MDELIVNSELVRPVYKDMADLHTQDTYKDPYTTELMVEIFGFDDNHIITPDSGFENFTYIAKWGIPLSFLIFSAFIFRLEK